ncbi:YcdB/YcdC domain-containing protein [Desulfuribacillus alkaliarsenatis]|uniref:SLH domain-containing protein n=1 Tax=Desulfuribacillus alkaliarsenatis TaxID=766136 RepID=A0A1E5G0Y4_9FIRM|nr:YcdB/YcdC domain-containing protein [Desulfuribacillus alkaliarsenatis]OEF96484.1 hypothetical protein BHF68_07455 [Desulfuribacillus alkaliarsenatis]
MHTKGNKQLSLKIILSTLALSLVIVSPIHNLFAMEIMPINVKEQIAIKEQLTEKKSNNEVISNEEITNRGLLTAEQALVRAKELFDIPKEFDSVHSNFQEDVNVSSWSFRWFSTIDQHGELTIRIDAKTGTVINYHHYNPSEYYDRQYQSYIPKHTWEQGRQIAEDVVERFSGKSAGEYQLISEPQYPLYKGLKHYEYRFEQLVDGIPFKGQNIQVTINADTGIVRSYYMQWIEGLDTNITNTINKTIAEDLFIDKNGMELAYIVPFTAKRDERNSVKLVYRPIKASQFAVDATSGEVFEPAHYLDRFGYGGMMETREDAAKGLDGFEQAELESLSGLLSQEQALLRAESYVDIPSNYRHVYSNMERSWDFPQNRSWNFRWEYYEESEEKLKHGTIEIGIDAMSGKLVRLIKYQYPEENQRLEEHQLLIKDEETAVKKAQEYISKHYPEHINSLKHVKSEGWKMLEGQELPLTYHLRFQRTVNGIVFDQNVVVINIDAQTGDVQYFQIVWADYDFPNPTNLINEERIQQQFLSDNPLELHFIRDFNQQEQSMDTKLVYTFTNLENTLYDAKTGKVLDYFGEEKKMQDVVFKDLDNHWAKEDIRFLQKYGVLPFTDEFLQPNKAITQREFVEILMKIERPYTRDFSTKEVNSFVTERRLYINDNESNWAANSSLNREEMAHLLIKFLNYDEVAMLDIFKESFADHDQISANRKGAVAIMNGLGIMTGGSNNLFMPHKEATRAEAVVTVAKLLQK